MRYISNLLLFACVLFMLSCNKDSSEDTNSQVNTISDMEDCIDSIIREHAIVSAIGSEDTFVLTFDNKQQLSIKKASCPVFVVTNQGVVNNNHLVKMDLSQSDTIDARWLRAGNDGNWYIGACNMNVAVDNNQYSTISHASIVLKNSKSIELGFSNGDIFVMRKCSSGEYTRAYFTNNPLPIGQDTLRVLGIGNSYTEDPTTYLNDIVKASGIDLNKCCVYVAAHGSATLDYWVKECASNDTVDLVRYVGKIKMKSRGTMAELLHQKWDVVVMQQVSSLSISYTSYNPGLRKMIDFIRNNTSNSKVSLAWQLVPAYYSGYGGAPYGEERWKQIASAAWEEVARDGIDVVIPVGTAIQNARNSSLETMHDLTRDGRHLSCGTGRYIACCTWFQSLFAPVFHSSILGNSFIHKVTEEEQKLSTYEWVDVTESNRDLCQKCAYNAWLNKYVITRNE